MLPTDPQPPAPQDGMAWNQRLMVGKGAISMMGQGTTPPPGGADEAEAMQETYPRAEQGEACPCAPRP